MRRIRVIDFQSLVLCSLQTILSISVPSLSVPCSDDFHTRGLLEDREVLPSYLSIREFSLETLALPSVCYESGRVVSRTVSALSSRLRA